LLQNNYTVAVTCAVHALPEKDKLATIFFRTGYYFYLVVDHSGKLVFSVWYNDMKNEFKQIKFFSPEPFRIGKGRLNRIAVTCETLPGEQLRAVLWLNGEVIGEKTVKGKNFFQYSKNIYIGSAAAGHKAFSSLDGVIRTCRLYEGVLTDEEIISLR
jgi:hypothetical protein